MKRKQTDVCRNPVADKREKKKTVGYIGDPRLLSRVREYLDSNKKKSTISMTAMAEDIQDNYREYGRKKKDAFRKCVAKAYQAVCEQEVKDDKPKYNKHELTHIQKRRKQEESDDSSSDSSEDSFSSDIKSYIAYEDTNTMNNFMADMYKQGGTPKLSSTKSASACSTPRSGTPTSSDLKHVGFVIDRTGDSASTSKKPVARTSGVNKDIRDNSHHTVKDSKSKEPMDCDTLTSGHDLDASASMDVIQLDSSGEDTPNNSEKSVNRDRVLMKEDTSGGEVKKQPTATKKQEAAKTHKDKNEKTAKTTNKVKTKDSQKKKKSNGKDFDFTQSTVKFCDIGGNEAMLQEVCKLLVHMRHPEVYQQLGVTPPRGVLLHGPPGCGKTLLAHAIAGELDLPFLKLAATEIVSGVSGESEEKLRDVFEKATLAAPCILFLDEIDAITQRRESASKDMERRIVSQLLTCLDDLNNKPDNAHVMVIGATNRPDSLDPALRRAGRFDREISLGIPDVHARSRILQVRCRDLRVSEDFDFHQIAQNSPGYVGADLMALTREAAITAVNRVFADLQSNKYKSSDHESVSNVTPPICDQEMSGVVVMDTCEEKLTKQTKEQEATQLKTSGSSASELPMCNMDTTAEMDKDKPVESSTTVGHTSVFTEVDKDKTVENRTSTTVVFSEYKFTMVNSCSEKTAENTEISDNSGVATSADNTMPMDNIPSCDIESENIGPENIIPAPMDSEKQAESRLDSAHSESMKTEHEYLTVLNWLKEQPPLTREQLLNLWITMDDFMNALKVVQPSAKREGFATVPDVTWDDIGALKDVREELQVAILAPVRHPEQFKALGLNSPPGILLAGPPGCGKTLLAKAVANESGINFISVKGPELLNMYVGESERAVRQVFQRARNSCPCVIFFDELDALCPRRSDAGEGGASVRVVNQLLTEMDGLEERKQVFIMAATNRPDIIDPAILRPGRLDKILYVGLPSASERLDILNTITKKGQKPKLADDVCLSSVANNESCNGFTGADLAALVREASVCALKEFLSSKTTTASTDLMVHARHVQTALSRVKPSVTAKDQLMYEKIKERVRH